MTQNTKYFLQVEAEGALLSIREVGTGNRVAEPMGWDEATRKCFALNREQNKPPQLPAPRFSDCARLEKAIAHARHELAQLSRTTRDAETADAALAAIDRLRDMAKGEV